MTRRRIWLFACCLAILTGCGRNIPAPGERIHLAAQISTTDPALQQQIYPAPPFRLLAYQSDLQQCQGESVHLYIEGDGLAWITPSTVSADPTPLNPVALKLAVKDPAACRIYLARPCQYLADTACSDKYWTSHRFSTEVIESYLEVCNTIKTRYDVASFIMFGYSGGGAIAALLAAQRDDITRLVTVAGNLDTDFWTQQHAATPLGGSLNPAQFSRQLANVDQIHLVGDKDNITGPSVVSSYLRHFSDTDRVHVWVYHGFGHGDYWEKEWPTILETMQ